MNHSSFKSPSQQDQTLALIKDNWDDFNSQLDKGDDILAQLEKEESELKSLEQELDGPVSSHSRNVTKRRLGSNKL